MSDAFCTRRLTDTHHYYRSLSRVWFEGLFFGDQHFQAIMAKLLGHRSITGIDTLTMNGCLVHGLRKVDTIEEFPVQVQHGGKAHDLSLGGGIGAGMHHGPIDQYLSVQMVRKIPVHQPAFRLPVHQGIVPAQGKPQQFQLVIGILDGMGGQLGQFEVSVFGLEQ